MQRTQDEVDEIQIIPYRHMQTNQRYAKARIQNSNLNGINRSSSSSRQQVDVYYEDLMTRSSDNYEYVLSKSIESSIDSYF